MSDIEARRDESVSRDLSARTAGTAARVADLLETTCSPESGAAEACAFLRRWADSATADAPARAAGPWDDLVARFALTAVEQDILLLAGLPEEHEGLASTLRSLHPRSEPYPTVGLAALLVTLSVPERAGVRRVLSEGALARRRLVEVPETGTFFERSLVSAPGLWAALHGHDAWPAELARIDVGAVPAGLEEWLELPDVRLAVRALLSDEARTILVPGDDAAALSRGAALAAAAGRAVAGARVAADDRRRHALLVAHAAARGALPLLVVPGRDGATDVPELSVEEVPGPVIVCTPPGATRPVGRRPLLLVPLGPIHPASQQRAWRAALPEMPWHVSAHRHPLDPAMTAEVAADIASRRRLAGGTVDAYDVSSAVRHRAGVTLPAGVGLSRPSQRWNRLVLPEEPTNQLHDAVARLEHAPLVLHEWGFHDAARARRGVRLLFTGPPGTGKTHAAEVVATALQTDLLEVDVSRVVSKWIGETEKNLAGVFDAAERTQSVLLLDEADALFGARTEISDAHDRYANLETAYLLQRMDRFDGLVVLATNMRQNIDVAFLRRMDFVVDFALPDEVRRRELWHLHLPERARPASDVDLEVLARLYPVPGAWIRNAAVGGAFLAAAEGESVAQRHLVAAMRREYAKASRPFPDTPVPLGTPSQEAS